MKFWKGKLYYYSRLTEKCFAHRSMIITPNLLHKKIKIYNGRTIRVLHVIKKYLFNKFGELFFTKKKSSYLKAKIKKKRGKIKKK